LLVESGRGGIELLLRSDDGGGAERPCALSDTLVVLPGGGIIRENDGRLLPTLLGALCGSELGICRGNSVILDPVGMGSTTMVVALLVSVAVTTPCEVDEGPDTELATLCAPMSPEEEEEEEEEEALQQVPYAGSQFIGMQFTANEPQSP
jgi:hypothetical protein